MSQTTVAGLLSLLDQRIDPARAAGWDPSGLQLGDPAAPVGGIGVCHEVTEDVVDDAVAAGVDLVVTYHPLLFHPTVGMRAGRSPEGRAFRLVRAGIALVVAHTAFDVAPGGAADALAAAVGLQGLSGFGPVAGAGQVKVVTFVPEDGVEEVAAAMSAAGAGRIGGYTGCSFRGAGTGAFEAPATARPATGRAGAVNREPEVRLEMVAPASREQQVVTALVAAHPYEEPAFDVYEVRSNSGMAGKLGSPGEGVTVGDLAGRVAATLGDAGLRVSGDRDAVLSRVAVVPGSGSSFLPAAAVAGAGAIVTGDIPHHRVVEALDRGMAVIDPGHAPTERPGVAVLTRIVDDLGVDTVDLTGHDPTPWR